MPVVTVFNMIESQSLAAEHLFVEESRGFIATKISCRFVALNIAFWTPWLSSKKNIADRSLFVLKCTHPFAVTCMPTLPLILAKQRLMFKQLGMTF
jgi:hypothetical protein